MGQTWSERGGGMQHSTPRHESDDSTSLSLGAPWPRHQQGPLSAQLSPGLPFLQPSHMENSPGSIFEPLPCNPNSLRACRPRGHILQKAFSSLLALVLSSVPCSNEGDGDLGKRESPSYAKWGSGVSNTDPCGLPFGGLGLGVKGPHLEGWG